MTGEEADMENQANGLIEFDSFLIDLVAAEIRRNGEAVHVEPQVFDLIALLCANPGRVVGHDEMMEKVWRGRLGGIGLDDRDAYQLGAKGAR